MFYNSFFVLWREGEPCDFSYFEVYTTYVTVDGQELQTKIKHNKTVLYLSSLAPIFKIQEGPLHHIVGIT